MKDIFQKKGSIAYIFVIFFNTIVDLGDKILLQNTIFKVYNGSEQVILTAFVNALILLPFIMFFTPSGFLSDKYPKDKILKYSSIAAFIIILFIMITFYVGYFELALFMTFLLATQSAFFSPAKYGYIKEFFGKKYLTQANAIVQAVTIVSILLSSLLFSYLFEKSLTNDIKTTSEILHQIYPITFLLIVFSILQIILVKKLPTITKENNLLKFDIKKYITAQYLKDNIKLSFSNPVIGRSIIGLSIFFAISQVILAIFATHLKEVTGETNTLIPQAIMAISALGIASGALFSSKVSYNYIETGFLPISSTGLLFTTLVISNTTSYYLLGTMFFLFGFFGGIVLVILNSLIQYRAEDKHLGRILATNNFVQNTFMLLFLILTILAAFNTISTTTIFWILSFLLFVVTIYTLVHLAPYFIRVILKTIAKYRYKFNIYGMKNIPENGPALLVGNHVSWIDWLIVIASTPRKVSFVIEKSIYEKKLLKPIFKFFGLIPISSRVSKTAFKKIQEALDQGKLVVLFPEGTITRHGHLTTFHKGFEVILKNKQIPIIPFYIRGLWGSRFSYASAKQKKQFKNSKRVVDITYGKPLSSTIKAEELKQEVQTLSYNSWQKYVETFKPIPNTWLKMAKKRKNLLSVADSTGVQLSNHKLLAVVKTFSKLIDKHSHHDGNIAVIMPSSVGGVIVNMAIFMLGKKIINLNYTANKKALDAAVEKADITTILTSKLFIEKLQAKGIDLTDFLEDKNILYIEDLKKDVKKVDVIKNLLLIKTLPTFILEKLWIKDVDIDDTAAILFSSGSEGSPKGIELTHKNLLTNIKQFTSLLNLLEEDVVISSLPIFHVFGLTVCTLAPLTEGTPFICQADPTDAEGIGKLTVKYSGTLLFGTSTFFRIYTKSKKLLPLMFNSVRFVVGGAEKLSFEVRDEFKKKFGLDIYEAYGATETSPGISSNIPDKLNPGYWELQKGNKFGTVGQPFPGTICKIVDPETYEELEFEEEGMIIVAGPQVMKGYLKDPQKTAQSIIQKDGSRWYITGDKGKIDKDGFLTIVDRYSRFVKIAGEMVSLGAVEEEIKKIIDSDIHIIAVGLPDSKKGEKIVLLYHGDIDKDELKKIIRSSSLNPLMYPANYFYVEEMPVLGSGKADFKKAKEVALKLERG